MKIAKMSMKEKKKVFHKERKNIKKINKKIKNKSQSELVYTPDVLKRSKTLQQIV